MEIINCYFKNVDRDVLYVYYLYMYIIYFVVIFINCDGYFLFCEFCGSCFFYIW